MCYGGKYLKSHKSTMLEIPKSIKMKSNTGVCISPLKGLSEDGLYSLQILFSLCLRSEFLIFLGRSNFECS